MGEGLILIRDIILIYNQLAPICFSSITVLRIQRSDVRILSGTLRFFLLFEKINELRALALKTGFKSEGVVLSS